MTQARNNITIRAHPIEACQTGKTRKFTIEVAVTTPNNARDLKSLPTTQTDYK